MCVRSFLYCIFFFFFFLGGGVGECSMSNDVVFTGIPFMVSIFLLF